MKVRKARGGESHTASRGMTHCGGEIWVVPIMSGGEREQRFWPESDSGRE